MVGSGLLWTLLARGDASGKGEALIGDLLEELSDGRSRWWLCQQLIGWSVLVLAAHVRDQTRVTPCAVAVALGAMLLGGISIASVDSVVQAWLGAYLVAGTLSLFAHMLCRAHVHVEL